MSTLAVVLSMCGALFQALGAAINKKSLQRPGINNLVGFVTFTVAGLMFLFLYFFSTKTFGYENLSARFWETMALYAGLNIVAYWFMYRALNLAEFNHLMPFMALVSISVIIPPIFVLGEIPTAASFFGIILIVIGAITMNYKKNTHKNSSNQQHRSNRKGALYFLVTAICFTFTTTLAKVTIIESSVLFSSLVVHLLIGAGFLVMLIVFKEFGKIKEAVIKPELRPLLFGMTIVGVIVFAENGTVNTALGVAPVASVMAIKRIMPLFAFLIGLFYFKERSDLKKKIIATALMVAGAIFVTIF
ncbi:MAG: EamA family transporter [Parcubacteria group bacterium]|jgi:drug/metabolite transporter (DMT)-like permease